MSGTTFPTRSGQIDSAWLTAVLREQGALSSGRVASFALQPLADPGQTADLCRIVLQYEGASASAPASLVAKFPAAYAPARELAQQYKSYVKEVLFYREIARTRDLPVPRAYAAEIDMQSCDFVLLLEDLSAARNGTLFGDSRSDVEIGLVQLARIHAAFWNDPLLDQHDFVQKQDDPPWNAMLKSVAGQLIGAARGLFDDWFSPYALSAMETWVGVWDDTMAGYMPDALTLIHVDAHPKQMFFPTAKLPRFAIFDWQSPCKNLAACDVVRLLVTGLSVEARRKHEQALVDTYYAALCKHGVKGLSKDRLWTQIKLCHVWNFYINVAASLQTNVEIFAAAAAADGCDDWRKCIFGRVNAATEDWKLAEVWQAYAAEARAAQKR